MGKKEQLEELDNQLIKAKKKISDGNFNIGTSAVLFLIGFLFPILWIFSILCLVCAIYYYVVYGRRINEINYEKAKLK
ncbi:MAG: hypothetical protein Q8R04_03745 [Nanoarchaeota archaeon]|nr:hypothetical protein [Nanoarchaeota archaeon]